MNKFLNILRQQQEAAVAEHIAYWICNPQVPSLLLSVHVKLSLNATIITLK